MNKRKRAEICVLIDRLESARDKAHKFDYGTNGYEREMKRYARAYRRILELGRAGERMEYEVRCSR